ncbi:hypothetical protein [Streptomyces europaeiscabiei]|uniref:hypothetical protein n=2 Tax=Streptomyces europaeiscabiei TaxID=146819 RepID=UPI0029B269FC|nr:hypothetical protein [Streptomyces europaeiscabiei]MDX2525492.1 hypothetical protein [Streptomyces europaeiscabiei]MDX3776751.1 hypothetical protein [Streptomyces europaeiscabiei]
MASDPGRNHRDGRAGRPDGQSWGGVGSRPDGTVRRAGGRGEEYQGGSGSSHRDLARHLAPAPLRDAARRRSPYPSPESPSPSPRPRVEVTFNELTGTMSWRALDRSARVSGAQDGDARTPHRRTPEAALRSARAAALRSAGLDPSRAPAQGAAPIPTHPAAVRAALGVDVASLSPEQRQSHLARLGALRSGAAADLAHGTRMPASVASRLRSTSATPAHTHALAAERTSAITRTRTPAAQRQGQGQGPPGPGPGAGPGPAAGPRR